MNVDNMTFRDVIKYTGENFSTEVRERQIPLHMLLINAF